MPPRSAPTAPTCDGHTARPSGRRTGIPEWVRHLDVPVWVSGPRRRLRYLNRRAEKLLGVRAEDWLGEPCHRAVSGRNSEGEPLCRMRCRTSELAAEKAPLPAVEVEVGPPGRSARWSRWTVIPVADPEGGAPWLVHTATDMGRARESESYLERVAARSAALREIDPTFVPRQLTPRESEILDLLADDLELGEIARELDITRTTVRNHVQRLSAAIGAHSVQEAVAMRLLGRC